MPGKKMARIRPSTARRANAPETVRAPASVSPEGRTSANTHIRSGASGESQIILHGCPPLALGGAYATPFQLCYPEEEPPSLHSSRIHTQAQLRGHSPFRDSNAMNWADSSKQTIGDARRNERL
jgi:hypothetical protein